MENRKEKWMNNRVKHIRCIGCFHFKRHENTTEGVCNLDGETTREHLVCNKLETDRERRIARITPKGTSLELQLERGAQLRSKNETHLVTLSCHPVKMPWCVFYNNKFDFFYAYGSAMIRFKKLQKRYGLTEETLLPTHQFQ